MTYDEEMKEQIKDMTTEEALLFIQGSSFGIRYMRKEIDEMIKEFKKEGK